MPVKMPEPTAENVQALHMKLIKDWNATLAENSWMKDLVHRRNAVEVLDDAVERNIKPFEIHSGRAGGIIEHATGLLMAMPSWSMEPISPKTTDKASSEQTEIVTAKIFEQQILRTDFWSALVKDILIYGRGFLKALPLPTVWVPQAGYPVRREGEESTTYLQRVKDWKTSEAKFPFVIQHLPVMNVLPLLDADDNTIATMEEKRVIAGILADENGMDSAEVRDLLDSNAVNWYDEMKVLEYIDEENVQYYLLSTAPDVGGGDETIADSPKGDYKFLKGWKHGLGKCPVVMFTGLKTEVSEYVDRYKSFLADASEMLEVYDFCLSRLATMVGAYYLPSYELKLPESGVGQAGKPRPPFKVILGGVTPTFSDELLQMLPYPQGLFDAEKLITEADDIIQRHTLEDVLFGRVQGSAPAFQVNLRINVARSKLTPISQHMAQGITNVMEVMFRGVEQLNETIVVDGDDLTVKMAKQARGRMTASIEPKGPIDRAQDIGTAKMFSEFGMPWDWIVENILDVENPAQLRIERLVSQIEQLPPVQAKIMAEVLDELDLMEEINDFTDTSGLEGNAPDALMQVLGELGGGGLGRGPFPTGGAPQTIQGGRGLGTENTQPQPGNPQVGTGVVQ